MLKLRRLSVLVPLAVLAAACSEVTGPGAAGEPAFKQAPSAAMPKGTIAFGNDRAGTDISAPVRLAGDPRLGELDATFNPQPEPPREIFRFQVDNPDLIDNPDLVGNPEDHPNVIDDPNLRPWQGILFDASGGEAGRFTASFLPAMQRGNTVHLRQQWHFELDAAGIADGTLVELTGVFSIAGGRLVMRGRLPDGSMIHVLGWLTRSSDGQSSLHGDLMVGSPVDSPIPRT
jgi:hypothetical protein